MMRGLWDRETVAWILLFAYMPLALIWLWFGGDEALARLGFTLLVICLWNLVFMIARAQPPALSAIATALAVAMLAPEDLGVLRLGLGVSFGIVMGELVFGGWGRNVIHPATVSLAFLGFGFPGFDWPEFVDPVSWAAIPVAVIGILTGTMPVALVLSATFLAVASVSAGLVSIDAIPIAGIVLVLLVSDPVASATTRLGRVMNGACYTGLFVMFHIGWTGTSSVQIAVAAALLASLAAPLFDEIAITIWLVKRRRRHGPE